MRYSEKGFLAVFCVIFLCGALSAISYAAGEQESMTAEYDEEISSETPSELFMISSDEPVYFYQNDEEYALFPAELTLDITGDGKCSAADARELLRIAAGLTGYDGEVSAVDISGDGKISSADARLALRYSAHLDSYYFGENGEALSGFVKDENGDTYYFGRYGSLTSGLASIDGVNYYFGTDGKMRTGTVSVNGSIYNFAPDGKALGGFGTFGGETYYFGDDGKAYSGSVTISGKQYRFENGKPFTGWFYDGLDAYYYYSDGHMAQDETMNGFKFNSSGVASATTLNETTLQVYIRGILKDTGASPSAIYNYVHNNYRYKYLEKDSPDNMVIRMLQNRRGACYDYAYLTKYLLEAAGYECYVVVGDSFNPQNGSEHDWVLVKVEGVWRHMDTQRGTYLKTDMQMRNLGYKWVQGSLPAAV